MCQNVRSAIDVIKVQKRKTLTKEETLMLFTKVIEDSEKMGERMTNLEKEVQDVKQTVRDTRQEVSDMNRVVNHILKILEDKKKEKKKTFLEKLKEMPKYFWITLWIIIIGLFSWLGVQLNIAGIGDIIKGG